MDLVGHDFLTLLDYTPAEIGYLLDLAAELKAKKRAGIPHDTLRGKNVALIFEKTSTRTRCSFEVAAHDLGMGTTYLDPTGSQIGKKESIADTAQVLSGMFEGIEYRGYGQAIVEELAKYASVPVWNGLTNEYHPTQILADFLTLREHFGKLQGLKFAYMGDARYNMGNSLMIGCAKMGLHFVACAPKAYWPDPALVEKCKEFARVSGGSITIGGVNVSDITDRERRTCIGCVEQHFSRVSGTVLDQITLGDPGITADMAKKAAKLAGIDDAVLALPDGYNTACTDGMFSQGEWQLLSIARAAAADPAVLLLDEITANLDAETEARVLEALRRASEGRTVLSISHRIYENLGGRTVEIRPAL